jgi:putative peptide zinc metalloprotease protein
MAEKLFSESWYRVAAIVPRLRAHAAISRHEVRGQSWYVIQDPAAARHHRINPAAYAIVARMDGALTLGEIFEQAASELGDEAPTQDAVIRLLGLLHAADLLLADVTPDGEEVFRRYRKREQARRKRWFANPLSLRVPLVDPQPLLDAGLPWVRPLFGWKGALLWVLVVGAAALQAGAHWSELSHDWVDRLLAPHNIFLLWLAYPLLKVLHELGHAFAARAFGGDVHELGIALLIFVPVPYVDASCAGAFPERIPRILVGAAGMLVEVFAAALCMFVWIAVEPGIVRTLAHNAMVIGSVSTVLFNANPLLRFDAYYMLADAVGIPNLSKRASEQLGYLVQRHAFGVREAVSPAASSGEAAGLAVYGAASAAYQWVALVAVALVVGTRFFGLGLLLAGWIVFSKGAAPLVKLVKFLHSSPLLLRTRRRAALVSGGCAAALVLILFVIPLPLRTQAQGVIWLPEHSHVRAGTDGFVRRVLAQHDTLVSEGQALFETEDPLLRAEVRVLEAKLDELRARYDASWREKPVEAELLRDQVRTAAAEVSRARDRERQRVIVSPASGLFVLPEANVIDRFVHRGELLGYVTDLRAPSARVVVAQSEVALVRERTRGVQVRLASALGQIHGASIARAVPGGTDRLPSAALGTAGGGRFAVDSADEQGTRLRENVFEFEVALPAAAAGSYAGERVYVRFDHGFEPLAWRWGRALRRLLLSRLHV